MLSSSYLCKKITGVLFQFIYHNTDHFFGIKKVWIDNFHKVPCSDLEKTIIDCLFKPDYAGGIVEIARAISISAKQIKFDKLLEYAIRFKSQAVIKRLGFLLELLEINNPIMEKLVEEKTASYVLLDTELPKSGKMISRWGIKITQVLSDLFGVTGMKILTDLSNGITDAETLAKYMEVNKRLLPKKAQAVACLKGKFESEHQFMLKLMLDIIAFLQQKIEAIDQKIDELVKPYQAVHELLQTIPGVKGKAANHIIAELSGNMDAFPDDKHLCSWAGLCPGNNESAGKKKVPD